MTPDQKDKSTAVLKKAFEITPISTPLLKAYTAEQVIQLIKNDREKVTVGYADYLRRLSIK